jgi:hypothetical protein
VVVHSFRIRISSVVEPEPEQQIFALAEPDLDQDPI